MSNRNEYMRQYHLKRYYRLRKEALDYLGSICSNCCSNVDLQIDHKNPQEKSIEIHDLLNVSLKVFWKEIEKCQVLCRKCHQVKSILEQNKKIAKGTHGTLSSYRYCKCDICKKAKKEYNQHYRLHRLVGKAHPL